MTNQINRSINIGTAISCPNEIKANHQTTNSVSHDYRRWEEVTECWMRLEDWRHTHSINV